MTKHRRPPLPPLPPLPIDSGAVPTAYSDSTGPIDIGNALAEAAGAAGIGDWSTAADRYGDVLAHRPDDQSAWVQYGHALKESGNPERAIAAYARAIAIDPSVGDVYLHIGHVHRMLGHRDDAIQSYRQALNLDASLEDARAELIHLGARDAVLVRDDDRRDRWERLASVTDILGEGLDRARRWLTASAYPIAAYDRFREAMPVQPPPGALPEVKGRLLVLVDARGASPARLRASLRSLQNQSVRDWQALIVAEDSLRDHSVGSFAHVDRRIVFGAIDNVDTPAMIVLLDAGVILDGQALAWLVFAMDRTGVSALFSDHDRAIEHWRHGLNHADPVFYGAFDMDMMIQTARPPAVLIARSETFDAVVSKDGPLPGAELRRRLALTGGQLRSIGHVPRVLASVLDLSLIADSGIDTVEWAAETIRPSDASPIAGWTTRDGDVLGIEHIALGGTTTVLSCVAEAPQERLLVVIPIRDEADMLARCLASMRRLARHPERIDYCVVDNRSRDDATRVLLSAEQERGVRILTMDEPFNWSRANNLAAAGGQQPNLLFANNDIEMLTPGWDTRLTAALSRRDVGAIGARLLYPDMHVQHAGILFGLADGPPVHDGRYVASDRAGPEARWVRTHAVAAVSGAFLGVRRDVWSTVDGFDEQALFVGYNDIDFCLRVRELGRIVQYLPSIELIHHESRTRGFNDSKARVAWDQGELADLHARWGSAIATDPGYNPQWAVGGEPFDGVREPSLRDIVRWIDGTARPNPWMPRRLDEERRDAWAPAALL